MFFGYSKNQNVGIFLVLRRKTGINYDPSHFIWQQIDYIKPVYEFKDKIFHVHYKDIKVYPDKLNQCGIMAYPLDFMSPKLPGLVEAMALNLADEMDSKIEIFTEMFENTPDKKGQWLGSKKFLNDGYWLLIQVSSS